MIDKVQFVFEDSDARDVCVFPASGHETDPRIDYPTLLDSGMECCLQSDQMVKRVKRLKQLAGIAAYDDRY